MTASTTTWVTTPTATASRTSTRSTPPTAGPRRPTTGCPNSIPTTSDSTGTSIAGVAAPAPRRTTKEIRMDSYDLDDQGSAVHIPVDYTHLLDIDSDGSELGFIATDFTDPLPDE